MTGTSKFTDKELEFRKELKRRFEIIKKQYKDDPLGDGRRSYTLSGTWGGVIERIENTFPYIKRGRK